MTVYTRSPELQSSQWVYLSLDAKYCAIVLERLSFDATYGARMLVLRSLGGTYGTVDCPEKIVPAIYVIHGHDKQSS